MYLEQLTAEHLNITQRIYAHRNLSALLVMEVEVQKNSSYHKDITIHLNVSGWWESRDIEFIEQSCGNGDQVR